MKSCSVDAQRPQCGIAAVERYQNALLDYQAVFKSDAAVAADLFLFDRKLLAKLGLVLKKQVPSRPQ